MIEPKRSLGQNFLNNRSLAEKIVRIVHRSDPGTILEIGTGTGVFTNLFSHGSGLISVEKDVELYKLIKDLHHLENVDLINSDIFDINLAEILIDRKAPFVAFGSLPYNQAKRIIRYILQSGLFKHSFFIIQKEVAGKYTTKSPSNRLSVTSSIFADCETLLDIAPGNFSPKPKVNSSLIHFIQKETEIKPNQINSFYKFINNAFSSPRKILNNNLPPKLKVNVSQNYLSKRPAEITPSEYIELFKSF